MIRNIYDKSMEIIYIFSALNVIQVFEMLHIVILVLREFNLEDSPGCIFVKNDST